ncbi:MAG TPA: two-component regulator propeller domain-containing protein [Verrucomicrobiota bacterium]|nr:two-component regulator propeller domain-containing protein [Verrucomicrobiota bacterium]HNU52978.1 two-component regulator propeller domain-containing protein [Verrucomicrobiota bacterium]
MRTGKCGWDAGVWWLKGGMALVLCGALGVMPGEADEAPVGRHPYTIDNWQVEAGLPQITINSIAQTPDGYLWLGTFNGLARFDGVRFVVFDEGNTPALGSSRIVRLEVDREGGLWIMTVNGGLARLGDGHFKAYGPGSGFPAAGAAAFVRDPEGRLLVVDKEGGLIRVEGGNLVAWAGEPGMGTDAPRLLVSGKEWCWIKGEGPAVSCSAAPFSVSSGSDSNPSSIDLNVSCAVRSASGQAWLAGIWGLARVLGDRLQGTVELAPFKGLQPVCMAEDLEGNLWIGTWAGGLHRRDREGRWQEYRVGSGLADDAVTAVFVDREGTVWVGTGGGGLHRFKPALFRCYDTRDGLARNTVMSVAEDRQGSVWIGVNGGGLYCWEEGRITAMTEPARLAQHPLVYSVLPDRDHGVWLGLYGRGALRLHGGAVTGFTFEEGYLRTTPWALFEDHAGSIWLGGDHGLQRYQAGRMTLFTRRDGLSCDAVHALAEDRDGTLYIGTSGGGLNCYRDGRFTAYTEHEGLADNDITSLCVDREGTLWIATLNAGVSRFQKGRFATVSASDGLPSNTIGTLLEDDDGKLWLGSNRGIVRVDREELNGYLDRRRVSFSCRVFDCSDGLNTVDCTGGGEPSCWKARDGRLWFATVKGAAVVDPRRLPHNSLPPPVVVEEAFLRGRPIWLALSSNERGSVTPGALDARLRASGARGSNPGTPRVTVPAGGRRLEFRFTGLSLVAPERVRFRYRLTGLEEAWNEAGSRRMAIYPYVPPGAYRFEVTACNNDGVWSAAPAVLAVTVLPHYWQTAWFTTLVLLALGGLLAWAVRRVSVARLQQRVAHLEQQHALERERARIAQDIHDDLGARLTQIGLLSELARRSATKPEQVMTRVQEIADRTRDTVQAMDEIVWAVDPAKDTIEGLMDYLVPMGEGLFRDTPIRCRIDIPVDLPSRLVPARARHGLLMAAKEALHNTLKHSRAAEVWIRARLQGSVLRIEIEDNGCGFEEGAREILRGGGHGLSNMRRRIEDLGGRFRISSRPGRGTTVLLEVDLAHEG